MKNPNKLLTAFGLLAIPGSLLACGPQFTTFDLIVIPTGVMVLLAVLPALAVYVIARIARPKFRGKFGYAYLGALAGGLLFGITMGFLSDQFGFISDLLAYGVFWPVWTILGSFAGAMMGYSFRGRHLDDDNEEE